MGTVLLLLLLLLLLDKVVLVVPGHERQRLRGVGGVLVVVVAQSVVVVLLLSNVGDGGGVRVVAVVGPVASLLGKYHNTSQVQVEPTNFFLHTQNSSPSTLHSFNMKSPSPSLQAPSFCCCCSCVTPGSSPASPRFTGR